MIDVDRAVWRDRAVFVSGATGFLGAHLVRLLVDAGAQVVTVRRDRPPPTSIERGWSSAITWVEGDVRDQGLLERVLGEHEIRSVFHLAAQTQVGVANDQPEVSGRCRHPGRRGCVRARRSRRRRR